MSAKALMVLGTASHVGKSLLTAGLGRIFSDDGISVAPFKAQNMSLNSAATPDGREIGRAQALQAEACRVVACAEMNPVLIKPSTETAAQVVLMGKVWGQVTASDYHQRRVEDLYPKVLECYHRLASQHRLMLLEGAGSPAEINLRKHDIVNMRMAHAADAACLLVGDIDRGGVFASLLGTVELLEPEDRARIRGFVINKFRGDLSLLEPGVKMIEQRLGVPCAGVVPMLPNLGLEDEDSVSLEDRKSNWPDDASQLRIGVIALPHMANFTDFDALAMEPSVAVAFLDDPSRVEHAHVLILPGTKQTLDDRMWLRDSGFEEAVKKHPQVVGICGGFQMLGQSIDDPAGVESDGKARSIAGLGVLPVCTILHGEKTVRRATGESSLWPGQTFRGYEIHMGETLYETGTKPFAEIRREGDAEPMRDGAIAEPASTWGTYLHGLFDDDSFRHQFLQSVRRAYAMDPATTLVDASAQREARMDRWAAHVRKSLNMDLIRGWLGDLR